MQTQFAGADHRRVLVVTHGKRGAMRTINVTMIPEVAEGSAE